MATREPIRFPLRLGWSAVLQLVEPLEVVDVWSEGRETFFVILARFADGRYALWSQASWSGIRCTEPELYSTKEAAEQELDTLVQTVVDCANAQARA
ncbi:MAG: hypothetical protein ACOX6T_05560 [Myxococcales bacterium]